jgi:hypothetical protein
MSRRLLVCLSLALAAAGAVVVPMAASTAVGATPPVPTCAKDTPAVGKLTQGVTDLATALKPTTLDGTKVGGAAGDLFTDVVAAQTAGCLPALPTSAVHPMAAGATTPCAADTVALLFGALDEVSASTVTTPAQTAMAAGALNVVSAVTGLNSDGCLPAALPVPPAPPLMIPFPGMS